MRWIACAIAALSLATTAFAGVAPPLPPSPPAPVVVDEAEFAIPTRVDRIGRVLTPVRINGQGPFRFVVDTGANRSVVSARTAQRLGLQPHPLTALVHGVTGSRDAPVVTVGRLEADRYVMRDQTMPVLASTLEDVDGVLAVDGLAGKRLTVDFVRDRIEIAPSRRGRDLDGAIKLPGKLRFGALFLTRARVGSVPVAAVIDTGAERTIANTALLSALRAKGARVTAFGAVSLTGVTGQEVSGELVGLPTLRIGQGALDVTTLSAVVADAHVFRLWDLSDEPALLIGMDVLGQFDALALDYGRAEMQVVLDDRGAVGVRNIDSASRLKR